MRRIGFLLLVLVVVVTTGVGAAPDRVDRGRPLPIADVFEYTLETPDLVVEQISVAGETFDRVSIPGLDWTGDAGQPQVPVKNILLGSPGGEVRVEVLAARSRALTGLRLPPSPAHRAVETAAGFVLEESFDTDVVAHRENSFYPGHLADVEPLGMIRDQAVVQLKLFPVQYNPATDEVRLVDHLAVRVVFSPPETEAAQRPAGGAVFERLLSQTLSNYAELDRDSRSRTEDLGQPPASLSGTAAQSPALKITVVEDGIYQLTYDDLVGAGLDPGIIDPQTIKITNLGIEIPILVEGEGDGQLDPDDVVLFYGSAIADKFTVNNVYWLTYGGASGLRVAERDGTPGQALLATTFLNTLHAEEDHIYWQQSPDFGADKYFWDRYTAPETGSYPVQLHNIADHDETGELRVMLRGRTDDKMVDPDHHTRISLNGVLVSDEFWNGQIEFMHQVSISQSLLLEGENTVLVESVGDTGAVVDDVYLNWFQIDYWDTYVAEDDLLVFDCPESGPFKFEITGFGAAAIEIYDITDPLNVALMTHVAVDPSGGGYLARFEDACFADTRYMSLERGTRRSPVSIVLDEPSDLKSPDNGADYILITHQDFTSSAMALGAHRSGQGWRVEVVQVADIYDEFSHGLLSPHAIRDFLHYAYENWVRPAPQYVVLMGDATVDYRDNLGTGNINYVPPWMIEMVGFGEIPIDNWYVAVSGDDVLPDLFLGRISVRNPGDAAAAVAKIIAYETNPVPGDWNRAAVFVADDDDIEFENHSNYLASLLPGGFDVQKLYARQYPPGNLTEDIIAAINEGAVLVNYTGHGNVDNWGTWSGGRIFQTSNIASLTNGGKLPFVTTANCLNGYYAHPYSQWGYSLAEEFVRVADKGAIAAWSPSGLGYPSGHRLLMRDLLETIVDHRVHELGPATTTAKILLYNRLPFMRDLVETFVLFGDPATELNLPPYPTVTGISPDSAMIDTSVSVTITGTYFAAGAQAALVIPGEPEDQVIPGTGATVVSPTLVTATFDLTGAAQGPWDVEVANVDGLSHRLRRAFTVGWLETYVPMIFR